MNKQQARIEMHDAEVLYDRALWAEAKGNAHVYEELRYYTPRKAKPARVRVAYDRYVRAQTRYFEGR